MKIGIVGIKGLPADYGGFETFAEKLILENYKLNSENEYSFL